MTDRNKVYKLAPPTIEWPDDAEYWAVDEGDGPFFYFELPSHTHPFTRNSWYVPALNWLTAPPVTLPPHISWRDTLVSRAELEAWEAGKVRPTVVCLCGSTRFYEAYQEANYHETMAGNIVLTVGFYSHRAEAIPIHGETVGITPGQKVMLDELHKRKIDMADEILVLNVNGYIGDSTRSEIAYAEQHGKRVRWLEPTDELDAWEAQQAGPQPENSSTRELLAQYAHNAWAGWMHYLFSKCHDETINGGSKVIPAALVERWQRMMTTAYIDLPEDEKEADRREADEILAIIAERQSHRRPQKWTDEAIRAEVSFRTRGIGPSRGSQSAFLLMSDVMRITKRVRDDTAAERAAHWQARVDAVAKRHVNAEKRVVEANKRVAELESKIDKSRDGLAAKEEAAGWLAALQRIAALEESLADRQSDLEHEYNARVQAEQRLEGTGRLLDEAEKAGNEARSDAVYFDTDLETAEGIIKRLETEMDKRDTRIAKLEQLGDEYETYRAQIVRMFGDDGDKMVEAAELLRLNQLFQEWLQAGDNPRTYSELHFSVNSVAIYSVIDAQTLYDGTIAGAIAWLESQQAQPDERVSVAELWSAKHQLVQADDSDWHIAARKLDGLIERIRDHGFKPQEDTDDTD